MSDMVTVKGYCAEAADVLAAVCKAAAAGVCYLVAAHRAFVAGDINDLDNIWVALIAAHSHFYSFGEYSSFLINAAAHGRGLTGDYGLRDIYCCFRQAICPGFPCDFTQDFVFQMLYFRIKFSHFCIFPFVYIFTLSHCMLNVLISRGNKRVIWG